MPYADDSHLWREYELDNPDHDDEGEYIAYMMRGGPEPDPDPTPEELVERMAYARGNLAAASAASEFLRREFARLNQPQPVQLPLL
jgi:hypothetical protein